MKTIRELRLAAARRGDRFFDAGRPCARGHQDVRYTASGRCRRCELDDAHRKHHEVKAALQAARSGPGGG